MWGEDDPLRDSDGVHGEPADEAPERPDDDDEDEPCVDEGTMIILKLTSLMRLPSWPNVVR